MIFVKKGNNLAGCNDSPYIKQRSADINLYGEVFFKISMLAFLLYMNRTTGISTVWQTIYYLNPRQSITFPVFATPTVVYLIQRKYSSLLLRRSRLSNIT